MGVTNMATVSYGDVEFEMRQTKGITRQAVFSANNTYLYTRWTFDFTAVLNPWATSLESVPEPLRRQLTAANPIQNFKTPAPLTDIHLRHYLMQPRRKLIYKFGNFTLMETPARGYGVDAFNGPVVEQCNVEQTFGYRTFIVHMKIVAHVNECQTKIPVLSHTWKRSVEYDQDYYAAVTTEGTAVFRSDLLERMGRWPDLYRNDFLHPVPEGFRRERIYVVAEEDAVTYHYLTLDRQVPFMPGASAGGPKGVPTHFEGFFTSSVKQGGSIAAAGASAAALVEGSMRSVDRAIEMGAQGVSGAVIAIPGAAVRMGNDVVRQSMAHYQSQIPQFNLHGVIRAWGSPDSNRLSMFKWAIAILTSRLALTGEKDGDMQKRTNEFLLTESLNQKYIEVQLTQSWPVYPELAPGEYREVINAITSTPAANAVPPVIQTLIPALPIFQEISNFFGGPGHRMDIPGWLRNAYEDVRNGVSPILNIVPSVIGTPFGRPNIIRINAGVGQQAGVRALPPDNPTILDVLLGFFPDRDDIDSTFRGYQATVGNNLDGHPGRPPLVNIVPGHGGRGQFVGNLLANALSEPCKAPPSPPGVGDSVPLTIPPAVERAVRNGSAILNIADRRPRIGESPVGG